MPAATEKPGKPARTPRGNDLAKIHIAAKQLGLDEPTYRDMLWSIARCRSAKDLDHAGRKRVLDHLVSRGARIGRAGAPRAAGEGKSGLQRKIEAQLAEMGLPWAYALGIAKQMFGVDRLEFATPDMMRKIVAALAYRQKKMREGEAP